jgi:hypothetical protein
MTVSQFVEDPAVQLAKVSATGRDLMIQGEELEVKPLKFKQLLATLKHLAPILALVEQLDKDGVDTLTLQHLLETVPDSLVKVASLCTGKDEAWFDLLEADEGIDVLGAVLELNKDFFVQRLKPKFDRLREQLGSRRQPGTPASTT